MGVFRCVSDSEVEAVFNGSQREGSAGRHSSW